MYFWKDVNFLIGKEAWERMRDRRKIVTHLRSKFFSNLVFYIQ